MGDAADGIATRVSLENLHVNIGAVTDGVMQTPQQIAVQFLMGDDAQGMLVEAADKEKERAHLSRGEPQVCEPLGATGAEGGAGTPLNLGVTKYHGKSECEYGMVMEAYATRHGRSCTHTGQVLHGLAHGRGVGGFVFGVEFVGGRSESLQPGLGIAHQQDGSAGLSPFARR